MLDVRNLSIYFELKKGRCEAVSGVSFTAADGEILGIVGESGSGKTTAALAIAGLLKKNAVLDSGRIILDGVDLLALSPKEMRKVQGKDISMIFQEPMTALNPTMRIGKQVEEALKLHTGLTKEERRAEVIHALDDAELPDPESLLKKYPHELSGGMRQRVMTAAAIVCRPKLLIADEPTTALDVATAEGILKLLKKLNQKYKMTVLFISHNLRVVKEICGRVLVMKDGRIIEEGSAERIFKEPKEEYTRRLIAAIPPRAERSAFCEAAALSPSRGIYAKAGGGFA